MRVDIYHNSFAISGWDFTDADGDDAITVEVDGRPWIGLIVDGPSAIRAGRWEHNGDWVDLDQRFVVPRTEDEAHSLGWAVDRNVYPWLAYKGDRFTPEHITPIHTPAHTPR